MSNRENWIKIDRKVFCESDFDSIESLLVILSKKPKDSLVRYNFFVDVNITKIKDCENYLSLSKSRQELVNKQFKASYISGKNTNFKYLITNKKRYSSSEFSIQQALRFFETPVFVVLENGRNDLYFLKAIFKFFDEPHKTRNRLLDFYNNGWLKIENAGGWTNIKNNIISIADSLQEFSVDEGRDAYEFIRCLVIMDSDKEFPNDFKEDKENLKNELQQLGIHVHILNKRAMENYMPDEIIENESKKPHFLNVKKWYEAYKFLLEEQKDYLNFSKGFPKEKEGKKRDRNLQKDGIKKHYSATLVSDKNYDILDEGINYPKFKEDFPKNFASDLVHKRNLLNREGGTLESNEFKEIINYINELL